MAIAACSRKPAGEPVPALDLSNLDTTVSPSADFYKYATGYSSAVALSEKILTEGEPAVKKYLEFLSMAGSDYPLATLQHGGVDLSTPEPIERALKKFESIVEEAEKTYEALQA